MKIMFWIAIALVGSMLCLISYCHYIENPTSYYANYEKAEASGLMEKEWIPTFIPQSSTKIKETHNIDINTVNMDFNDTLGDTKAIEKNCEIIKSNENLKYYKCSCFRNDVHVELHSDGTGKLKSKPKY